LLHAFHLAAIQDSYLVYVGNGPLLKTLQAQISRFNIEDQVNCLGELSYDKLVGAYVAADILVHPAEFEPWGLIVNEAMLCGVPVIASSKVGAAMDLVEQAGNGFIYSAGDIEELAETLKAILSDNDKRKEFGLKSKARMQTWSPIENAAAHLMAIEKIKVTGNRSRG